MRFQLTSAPSSSGCAWLFNVLLELNIRTTNLVWEHNQWRKSGTGVEIDPEAYLHLGWHFPSIIRGRIFHFKPDIEVIMEHRLDFARNLECPTILYIRDPRDAIYSYFRRHFLNGDNITGTTYLQFLNTPRVWPHHFPGLFNLTPTDTWAYFNLFWHAMGEIMPVKVVRFEEMRADPLGITKQVLEFMNIQRSDTEILRALELSTHEQAKQAMLRMREETQRNYAPVAAGKVNEWQESCGPAEHGHFEGSARYAMQVFGYEFPPDMFQSAILPEIDPEQVRKACSATTLECLDAVMHQVHADPADAEARLWTRLNEQAGTPADFVMTLCSLTALRWTRAIFIDACDASKQTQLAAKLFRDLNVRFLGFPSVQQALVQSLSEDSRWQTQQARAQVYTRLGEALYSFALPQAAETALLTAGALNPACSEVHNDLAVLYWEQANIAQAVVHVEKALRLNPKNEDALINASLIRAAIRQQKTA